MPVTVSVPIRLRVDPEALEHRRDLIDEAIEAAVGRALAASSTAVLAPRGSYLRPAPTAPVVRWTGSGLARVGPHLRRDSEERLTTLLAAAFARALPEADRVADGPIPFGDAPEERIDPDRLAALTGLYVVPSYGDEGGNVAVPAQADGPRAVLLLQDLMDYGTDAPLMMRDVLDEVGPLIAPGQLAGVLALDGQRYYIGIFRRRASGEGFDEAFYLTFEEPMSPDIVAAPGSVKVESRKRSIPAVGPMSVELVGTFANPEERLTVLIAHRRVMLEQLLDRERERLVELLGPDAFEALTTTGLEAESKHVQDEPGRTMFWRLNTPSGPFLFGMPAFDTSKFELPSGPIPVYPFTDTFFVGDETGEGEGGGGGAKEGAKTGAGGKGGTGDAKQGAGGPPAFVTDPNAADAVPGGRTFPTSTGEAMTLTCAAFNDEPSIDELGPAGATLRTLMERIAFRLQMGTCDHAGRFVVNAALVLGGRAHAVGKMAAEAAGSTKPIAAGRGNFGGLEFRPVPSEAIQLLRHLAGTVPYISAMEEVIAETYKRPEHSRKLGGRFTNEAVSWRLQLLIELSDAMGESVSVIFGMACRSLFLQLLRSSRDAIDARIRHFNQYAPLFERLIAAQLMEVDELNRLRKQLVDALPSSVLQDVGSFAVDSWRSAHRVTADIFGGNSPFRPSTAEPGKIVKVGDRVVGVSDSDGRVWTKEELDQAIATRQQTAEGIDPLVKQIRDLPDLMERLRANRTTIRKELWKLLNEMHEKNADTILETEASWMFAVKASTIVESAPGGDGAPPLTATVRNSKYHLQHIHLMAHEAIGDAFMNDGYYGAGIDWIFDSEMGKAALREFFEFTGLVVLAVLCAPLAVAVGAAVAGYHLYEAYERESIYMSLIDPDLVLSAAEVEAGLFAAELGALLAFLPAGKQLATGATVVTKAIVRRGVSRGAQVAMRYYRQRLTQQIVQQLQKELVPALVKEFAEEKLEDYLFDKLLMGPAMEQLQNELLVGAQAPVGATP